MHFVAETVARARRAGAAGELTLRADSGFFSYDLLDRLDALKVRRSRLSDPTQQQLWPDWRYHAFITNRTDLDTIAADAYHRAHATVELATGDLKNSTGLAHLPSGSFAANAAWLACAALAHNLYRRLHPTPQKHHPTHPHRWIQAKSATRPLVPNSIGSTEQHCREDRRRQALTASHPVPTMAGFFLPGLADCGHGDPSARVRGRWVSGRPAAS